MTPRHISIIGGGPAGLFLARMIRLTKPSVRVDVYERSGSDHAYGFGVALSDRTMSDVSTYDPHTCDRIIRASAPVSGVGVRLGDSLLRYDGFGASAISRHALLRILRQQASDAGARIHHDAEVREEDLDSDLIAMADGAGNVHNQQRRQRYGTALTPGRARYIWLGLPAVLGDLSILSFVRTPYGSMAAHCYPHSAEMSTVVVETDETTWRNAGLDRASCDGAHDIDQSGLDLLSAIFEEAFGGHRLVSNHSRWSTFTVVRHQRWWHANTVLLGDAAHTAHFTVSSGTKMALEDGVALALALGTCPDRESAFREFERRRRPAVARTQRWAEPSMRWWETFGSRMHLPPAQFGMHFITRTGAVSYLGLRRRCPDRVDEAEDAYLRQTGVTDGAPWRHAALAPLSLSGTLLPHRVVTWHPHDPDTAEQSEAPGRATTDTCGVLRPACLAADGSTPAEAGGQVRCGHLSWPGGEWDSLAVEVLVQAAIRMKTEGAAGVYLRHDETDELSWDVYVECASRIRTEAELPVAVTVPGQWIFELTRSANTDSWSTRVHVALVAGRIDFVVPDMW